MENLPLPPSAAPFASAPRRSSRAHAPVEAMLNLQRVVPEGTYLPVTPVAVAPAAPRVDEDAASAMDLDQVVFEVPSPAGPDSTMDVEMEMRASPGSPLPEVSSLHPESTTDVETTAPAPSPAILALEKLDALFAALDAEIVANQSLLVSSDEVSSRVADLRQRLMRSASMLIPTRPAKPQRRNDLFTGAPLANVPSAAANVAAASSPSPVSFAAAAAVAPKVPVGNKRLRSSQPRREFSEEELAKCIRRPASAAPAPRAQPNWRVVHVKGFAPPKNTPMTALIALLDKHGLPAKTRTLCNISYLGFGMTEVVIEAANFDAFHAAAIAAGLQVSTTFNARLPCLRETAESAQARFLARINACIARLESRSPSAYFDDLAAFLRVYRDGDSNCPAFAPAARVPTQLETAFAPLSHSLPPMGEEY